MSSSAPQTAGVMDCCYSCDLAPKKDAYHKDTSGIKIHLTYVHLVVKLQGLSLMGPEGLSLKPGTWESRCPWLRRPPSVRVKLAEHMGVSENMVP